MSHHVPGPPDYDVVMTEQVSGPKEPKLLGRHMPSIPYLKKRLAITADNKSPPWTEGKVKSVLKSLKKGKSRDPLGLINEIFKVDGQDLIKSLTVILNRIKAECKVPQVFI